MASAAKFLFKGELRNALTGNEYLKFREKGLAIQHSTDRQQQNQAEIKLVFKQLKKAQTKDEEQN